MSKSTTRERRPDDNGERKFEIHAYRDSKADYPGRQWAKSPVLALRKHLIALSRSGGHIFDAINRLGECHYQVTLKKPVAETAAGIACFEVFEYGSLPTSRVELIDCESGRVEAIERFHDSASARRRARIWPEEHESGHRVRLVAEPPRLLPSWPDQRQLPATPDFVTCRDRQKLDPNIYQLWSGFENSENSKCLWRNSFLALHHAVRHAADWCESKGEPRQWYRLLREESRNSSGIDDNSIQRLFQAPPSGIDRYGIHPEDEEHWFFDLYPVNASELVLDGLEPVIDELLVPDDRKRFSLTPAKQGKGMCPSGDYLIWHWVETPRPPM